MAFDIGGILGGLMGGAMGQGQAAPPPGSVPATPIDYTGTAGKAADANQAYTNRMQPYLINMRKQGLNQWDPNYSATSSKYSANVLKDLGLGYQLPPELSQQSILGSMGQNASTGWGASAGGVGNAARNLGISELNLYNQRMNTANNWLGTQNAEMNMASNPIGGTAFTPNQVLTGDLTNQGEMNQYQNYLANLASQNSSNAATSLMGMGGTVAGGIMGLPGVSQAAGDLLSGWFGGGGDYSTPPTDFGTN